jgi:hypothetical protein
MRSAAATLIARNDGGPGFESPLRLCRWGKPCKQSHSEFGISAGTASLRMMGSRVEPRWGLAAGLGSIVLQDILETAHSINCAAGDSTSKVARKLAHAWHTGWHLMEPVARHFSPVPIAS